MILRLNEDELFMLTSSTNNPECFLPDRSENFKSRMGIKMISEDGTNFLQGFGAFDILTNNSYKVVKNYVAPECRNIGFEGIIDQFLHSYAKEITMNNVDNNNNYEKGEDSSMNKRIAKKQQKKNKNNNDIKKVSDAKPEVIETLVKPEEPKIEQVEKVEVIKEVAVEATQNVQEIKESNNVEVSCNATIGDNHIINCETITDEAKANSIVSYFTEIDKLAELPARNKNSIGIVLSSISFEGKEVGFIIFDIYKTNRGTYAKLLNIFVLEDYRNVELGKTMFKHAMQFIRENTFGDSKINAIFVTAVGSKKEVVAKIAENNGFTNEGKTRGRINLSIELN